MSIAPTTTAEALAKAVLEGSENAVWPLVDHLLETREQKRLPPLKTVTVDAKTVKAIFFVNPALGPDVVIDVESLENVFRQWLSGRRRTLALTGIHRVEFYDLRSK